MFLVVKYCPQKEKTVLTANSCWRELCRQHLPCLLSLFVLQGSQQLWIMFCPLSWWILVFL